MLLRFILATAALVGAVGAQLTITAPSSSLWWVANSQNTLAWTCNTSPYENFTILIANSNPSILVAPLALISIEQNFQCSQTITQQQSTQPASTGYTILFANTLNVSDIYATSQSFEIQAFGSAYPTTTSAAASATGSSSPSATATTGGALAQYAPTGFAAAAALALALVVA